MHVFVTGGSGLTGPSVVTALIAAGHRVTGLARSERSAERLRGLGAGVLSGSLDDHAVLRQGAEQAEGVLHMGFGGDFADPDELVRRDRGAIEALADAVLPGQPLVITSGTLVMRAGSVSHEQDPPDTGALAWFRIPGEQACLAHAQRGVRAAVVRLSPTVHGPGDYGFVAMLVSAARRTGVSAYIGDGSQRWPAVHREDAATLFRLALERAAPGTVLHGAAEEGVTLRAIAETIGSGLGLPVRSITPEAAADHFGDPFMARVFATDAPAASAATRERLGWVPTHRGLLEDIAEGDYLSA